MPTGTFITFEGGEGSGKSTQSKMLFDTLKSNGRSVIWTREPGGTKAAEIIRHVILSGIAKEIGAEAEAILFYAARMDHVNTLIKPALENGTHVICDRFFDSTTAYQMAASGVSEDFLNILHDTSLDDFKPDLTFIFDIDPAVAKIRVMARDQKENTSVSDRFESEDLAFHQEVRRCFQNIALNNPDRCRLVDAEQDQQELHSEILDLMNARFPGLLE